MVVRETDGASDQDVIEAYRAVITAAKHGVSPYGQYRILAGFGLHKKEVEERYPQIAVERRAQRTPVSSQ